MIAVSRYHPVLVAMHWLLAALIIAALALGALVMARIPNTDPMKIEALRSHMVGGGAILLLMLTRLLVRVRTDRPPAPPTGNLLFDWLAWLSHRALYALVIAQAASGAILALQARLPEIIFAHQGALPSDFWIFSMRAIHWGISRALMVAIALHLAGATYHAFYLRDGLLRRMWFGRRVPSPTN